MPLDALDEAPSGYDLFDLAGCLIQSNVGIKQIADEVRVDAAEISWAIEEFGRCETDQFLILPADPRP